MNNNVIKIKIHYCKNNFLRWCIMSIILYPVNNFYAKNNNFINMTILFISVIIENDIKSWRSNNFVMKYKTFYTDYT